LIKENSSSNLSAAVERVGLVVSGENTSAAVELLLKQKQMEYDRYG